MQRSTNGLIIRFHLQEHLTRVRISDKKYHACNPSHDGEVADVDDDAFGSAFDGVGREEGQVLGFQRVFMSELR